MANRAGCENDKPDLAGNFQNFQTWFGKVWRTSNVPGEVRLPKANRGGSEALLKRTPDGGMEMDEQIVGNGAADRGGAGDRIAVLGIL